MYSCPVPRPKGVKSTTGVGACVGWEVGQLERGYYSVLGGVHNISVFMNCVIVCAFITGEQIKTMRQAIADLPERESEHMHLLFEQSLRDWNRSPQENDGRNKEARNALLLKWYPRPNKRNIHPIPDQNGKIYTLFQTRNA